MNVAFHHFNIQELNLMLDFYLISILFLIFDIEVLLILPWAINFYYVTFSEFFYYVFLLNSYYI